MAAADAARQAWEQNRRDVDMDMEMEIDEESKPGLRRTNHVRIRRPRNSTTDIDAHILPTLVRNAVVLQDAIEYPTALSSGTEFVKEHCRGSNWDVRM
jgi:hypothetical protein